MSHPPPGDGHPEPRDVAGDPAGGEERSRPVPPGPAAGDDADLFSAGQPDLSDETPTVITRSPLRPPSSEDVFSGTLRGRRLAHFELLEPIGVGGMAAVIRARDLQLERQVALKILPPEMATDEENVRRFHQEARAAAKLDHENIARVFFCGEDQKLHFIAFEFVEGQNLRALIERRGRLPVAETIRYMLQVASGLAHAAERGVIHRDIKPSNIIISPHGRAKLVDMGLARHLDPRHDLGLTQSGVTLGTFDYISPEQALEPRDADVRSDLYSLGCTFYHALTGQPPVPEGTAARKLHHHQHVAPTDPRQLNPDVPDEVAAILARMMAKDPKERYQRPEHLVQHLVQVAQKLGAVAEVPDGVLFVDAPLPSPPRPRPLLMAVAAALALVVLVVLLGQTAPRSTNRGQGSGVRGQESGVRSANRTATGPTPAPDAGPPAAEPGPRPAEQAPAPDAARAVKRYGGSSPREAAAFLEAAAQKDMKSYLDLPPGGLDLHDLGTAGPGLVFDGGERGELIIEPKNPKDHPTVRLQFDASRQDPPARWAALTVKSGTVRVRDVRFEIDATEAPNSIMAALCREGGELQVENCEFVQVNPSQLGHSRLSGVEVTGRAPPDKGPAVTLTRCCFLAGPAAPVAGQNAVTVTGGGLIQLRQCAAGPHAAVIALQAPDAQGTDGSLPLAEAHAALDHCSLLLAGGSAAVRLEKTAACELEVNNCLFSRPGPGPDEGSLGATLIRQVDEPVVLKWTGSQNRYHNLDAYWSRPMDEAVVDLKAFQGESEIKDEGARALDASPWKSADPLALLTGKKPDRLRDAFEVDPDRPELRLQPPDKGQRLAGVEQLLWGPSYTDRLPPLVEKKPGPDAGRVLVVTPDPKDRQLHPGDYSSLAEALDEAAPGDTVLLRRNGPCPVRPIPIKPTADVTIKPYPGCHPVLTLHPETDEEEAALFRLHDGKLRLEGLELALHPARASFKTQSVVAAVGGGDCTFTDCVLTLEQAGDTRLAAVTLADLPGVMKMDSRPPVAHAPGSPGQRAGFTFRNCFVRGDGDLVAARTPRPFDLDLDNALVVLGGSFLNVDLGDEPAPEAASTVRELAHVTAYLGGHLVRLHARNVNALVPVQFQSVTNCLFVSAGGSHALIHVDGPEVSDDRLKTLLTWEGQHNAYTDFPQQLDQQPDGGAMPAMPYTRDRWKEFTGETGSAFDRVRFRDRPAAGDPLAQVTPARFHVKADEMTMPDMQDYGAAIDQLPKVAAPADTMKTTTPDEE